MKILCITNMYPSQKYPHYGVFVENFNKQIKFLGYDVKVLKISKTDNSFIKYLKYIWLYTKALYFLIFTKFDFVYVHYPALTGIPVIFAKKIKKNIKIISNVHGNDLVPEIESDKKFVRYTNLVLEISEKIIVPSSYFEDIVKKRFPDKKIIIYPSGGVDTDVFKTINRTASYKELNVSSEYVYIGYIGRIEHNKGWDIFLKAFKLFISTVEYPEKYKAIIVGSGTEENNMKKMIDSLGLTKYILLDKLVEQKKVNVYMNVFSVFCFPTMRKSESLGLIGLEAMAAGTIVIASDLYGPSSYIEDGKNGYSFRTGDAVDLSRKIRLAVAVDDKERKKIVIESKKTVSSYSKNNTCNSIKRIFGG